MVDRALVNTGSQTFANASAARAAQVREVLVDAAVAVVVQAITSLVKRHALDRVAFNSREIGGTDPHAGIKALADTFLARATLVRPVLVDLAVAVVIDTVAQFGGRGARGHAAFNPGQVRGASEHAGVGAGAHADGAYRVLFGPCFIDQVIAVVVQSVAQFNRRSSGDTITLEFGAVARADPDTVRETLTDTNIAHASLVDEVLVDRAIAVVVPVIAYIEFRSTGHCVALCVGAIKAAFVEPGSKAFAGAGKADLSKVREILVERGVAIVVQAVAQFRFRRTGDRGAFDTVAGRIAHHRATAQTLTRAGGAGSSDRREGFVHQAVAVIVLRVAHLGRRHAGIAGGPAGSRHARLPAIALTKRIRGHADPDLPLVAGDTVARAGIRETLEQRLAEVVRLAAVVTLGTGTPDRVQFRTQGVHAAIPQTVGAAGGIGRQAAVAGDLTGRIGRARHAERFGERLARKIRCLPVPLVARVDDAPGLWTGRVAHHGRPGHQALARHVAGAAVIYMVVLVGTRELEGLVDQTVTVVVQVVAHFRRRFPGGTDPFLAGLGGGTGPTGRAPVFQGCFRVGPELLAFLGGLFRIVVRQTVAVVVDPVAQFGRGRPGRAIHPADAAVADFVALARSVSVGDLAQTLDPVAGHRAFACA